MRNQLADGKPEAEALPDVNVERQRHYVRDGNVRPAAGISAGIDLALVLVADIHGEPAARAAARYMEYPYPESDERRI